LPRQLLFFLTILKNVYPFFCSSIICYFIPEHFVLMDVLFLLTLSYYSLNTQYNYEENAT